MMTRRNLVFTWATLTLASVFRPARAAVRPVVVELFTSQGCNSCPPADTLLGELVQRDDVLPLAFHVDYWDYIGWPDRFAHRDWTARQRAYSRPLGLRNIYTPQMVVDGRIDVIGSNRTEVERAIKSARSAPGTARVSLTRTGDGGLTIELGEATGSTGAADLLLVTYDRRHETQVMRGENAGKTLVEHNVVRSARRLDPWRGMAETLTVAASELPSTGDQCAVLVQSPAQGAIQAAATVALR